MDAKKLAELNARAAAALEDPERQRALMNELFTAVYNGGGTSPEAIFSVSLLFDLSCAASGTAIDVRQASGSVPCCVIICGYAGSSLRMLKPLIEMYAKAHPTWRIVASTLPGVQTPESQPQLEKQREAIAKAVGSAPRIIGHVISNMGHGLWLSLLRSLPGLIPRLRGVVYDCSVSRNIYGGDAALEALAASSDGPAVTVGTILMAVMSEELSVDMPDHQGLTSLEQLKLTRPPLELAAKAHAAQFKARGVPTVDGENSFDWHARTEPPVPAVCLAGDGDVIVPPSHISDWAAFLRASQPARRVTVVPLKGTHAQLLSRDPEPYAAAIEALLAEAMDDDAAAARAPPAAGSDEALMALLRSCALVHLQSPLAAESLAACTAVLAAEGRTALIKHLKEVGVDKLADRQKLATVVAKAAKESVPVALS